MKTIFGGLFAPKTDGADGGDAGAGQGDFYMVGGEGDETIVDKGEGDQGDDKGVKIGNDDDKGEGGQEDFTDPELKKGEDEGDEGDEGKDKVTKGEEKNQSLKLDPESIRELAASIRGGKEETGNKAETFTPAQIKEMLNPVEVDEQTVAELRSEDPKVAAQAHQKLALATVKNAVSIARVLIDKKAREFEAAMGPLMRQQEENSVAAVRSEFFQQHKDLSKYDKVVKAVAAEVDGSGKTKTQIFAEVAKLTRAYLKQMGIEIKPTANLGAEGVNKGGVPNPNRVVSSGRSGGDNNGQQGQKNNPDADIYVTRR